MIKAQAGHSTINTSLNASERDTRNNNLSYEPTAVLGGRKKPFDIRNLLDLDFYAEGTSTTDRKEGMRILTIEGN